MSTHIILTELYYGHIHGNPQLDGQYLVVCKFHPFTYVLMSEEGMENEEYDDDEDEDGTSTNMDSISRFYRENYRGLMSNSSLPPHSTIRNYKKIVLSNEYLSPQIAQCIILPTQETIAIIKTIWIKIIQRTWKKVYNNRKKILNHNILTNKFYLKGNNMRELPGIRGMLRPLYGKGE